MINSVSFRLATAGDHGLPTYDNTKLVAINTCPTWGIIRYSHHKTFNASARALPLEMGSAMHDVFAWVRLCTLMQQPSVTSQGSDFADDLFLHNMLRLFGAQRTDIIMANMPERGTDYVHYCKHGAINILETSGYYDDPSDKRRTLTNMEEAALAYIDRWRWENYIWQADPDDTQGQVGIEIPFDLVCDINEGELTFRYTGKIDGLQYRTADGPDSVLYLGENKTAARLNDAWSQSFQLSSQITGYCVAASVITEQTVRRALLFGLTVPLPKSSYDFGGVISERLFREDYHITRWVEWVKHTVELEQLYKDRPLEAPMYTHSCNRYFRACSFMPLCDASQEDRVQLFNDMETQEWSPLHEKVTD